MKILSIGDLHYGEQGNSERYNQQLLDFIEWATAKFPDVDAVVQMGDYYHNRNSINVLTLNYGIKGAEMMRDAWGKDRVFVLGGNHCMYYLERLDVSSLAAIKEYVNVVDNFTFIDDGNVLLSPWITDSDMWEELIRIGTEHSPKFCLGHFELNNFMVNDAYLMKDGYSPSTLSEIFGFVVSGHYHSPQCKGNIRYTGTPLPITMNEANEDHGVWLIDTETGEQEFHVYDKVKVLSVSYTDITHEFLESLDPENTTIRLEFPDDLEDETLIEEYSEILSEINFKNSKIKYKGKKVKEILDSDGATLEKVENIDGLVLTYIDESINVSGVDNALLRDLYIRAKNESKETAGD